jgi:hypothetical protein
MACRFPHQFMAQLNWRRPSNFLCQSTTHDDRPSPCFAARVGVVPRDLLRKLFVGVMTDQSGLLLLVAVIGGLLYLLLHSRSREDRQYLAARREQAIQQFSLVEIASSNPAFAVRGAAAEIVHEQESVSRTNGMIGHYSLTRYVRNQHGEHYMLISTEGKPFVKHVTHEAAKAVLKSKYRAPNEP